VTWWTHDGTDWRHTYTPQINVDGAWRPIVRAYVYQGGVWYRFHPNTEPTAIEVLDGFANPPTPEWTQDVGYPFTVTGRVMTQVGVITGGVVNVKTRRIGQTDADWVSIGTGTAPAGSATSSWNVSVTATACENDEFKVFYEGTGANAKSETGVFSLPTIRVRTPAKPTGVGVPTLTTASFSWPAIAGATTYAIQKQREGGSWVVENNDHPGLQYDAIGLEPGVKYNWRVVAVVGACSSAPGAILTGQQAQNSVRDVGTMTIQVNSEKADSWRPDVGWGYLGGEVAQGFWSSTNSRYTGCIDYGGAALMRTKCIELLGAAGRFDNGNVTGARVYLFRVTGGSGSGVTYSFFNSTGAASTGGQPPRNGTVKDVTSTAPNAGKWYDIGAAHGLAVAKGTGGARSIVLYDSGSSNADYARNDDRLSSPDSCDISLDFSWDYMAQADIPGSWT